LITERADSREDKRVDRWVETSVNILAITLFTIGLPINTPVRHPPQNRGRTDYLEEEKEGETD